MPCNLLTLSTMCIPLPSHFLDPPYGFGIRVVYAFSCLGLGLGLNFNFRIRHVNTGCQMPNVDFVRSQWKTKFLESALRSS
jgi:hypothetical protein